jgi:elongation factor P
MEGRIYEVVDVERQKLAQRQPHIKTKLKETITGKVIERTFVSSDELKSPDVSLRYAKFLYILMEMSSFLLIHKHMKNTGSRERP